MISKQKFVRTVTTGLSVLSLAGGYGLAAFADTESGGFVFGEGSESGGAFDSGSGTESGGMRANVGTTESGGFYNSGASTESGGERASGGASESGGLSEVGSESESGGVTGKLGTPATYVKNYNWGSPSNKNYGG